jgi:DNA-binding NarL/FixJ family response regulator
MTNLKILIVDDHKLVRVGIKYTLETSNKKGCISKIDEASSGDEALQLASVNLYDVILMDINMPEKDGIETTKEIISKTKNSIVIALSMHDEEYQIKQMMNAGARGYLLKNTGPEILNAAIEQTIKGGLYFSNEVSIKLMQLNNPSAKPIVTAKNQTGLQISKREKEILVLIADEKTNDEIAQILSLSKRTVDTHRQNILNKLNLKNTAGLIRYAVNNNLV